MKTKTKSKKPNKSKSIDYDKYRSPVFDDKGTAKPEEIENEIKRLSVLIEIVVNSLRHPFYVVNQDYTIALINKAAKEYGILEGEYCYQLTHKRRTPCSGKHPCPLEEVFRTQKPVQMEHVHYNKDGNETIMAVYGDPILDEGGNVVQMIVSSIDITRRKDAEESLRKSRDELAMQAWGLKKTNKAIKLLYKELEQKNKKLERYDKVKSDFVSNVSHELRTPLTPIREAVSLVLDETTGKINQNQKKFLSIAKKNIDRLSLLINDLLDISRVEAGRIELDKEPIDMKSIIKDVLETFKQEATQKGIASNAKCPPDICQVYADRDKIIQVLSNLISNAIKFTEKGQISVNSENKGSYIQISVTDTGKGIPIGELETIFDKFKQIKRKAGPGAIGTGLGLAISKGIVEAHGGKIWAESKGEGKGSTFIFTLPKAENVETKK